MIAIEKETIAERLFTVTEFDELRALPENKRRRFEPFSSDLEEGDE